MNKSIPKINSFAHFVDTIEQYKTLPALSLSDGSISFTYAELVKEIKKFSNDLTSTLNSGDRVIISDLTGPYWVIALFAVLLNGGVVVPLDNRMTQELRDAITEDVGAIWIITKKLEMRPLNISTTHPDLAANKSNTISKDQYAQILYTSGTWGTPKGVTLTHDNLISNINSAIHVHQPSPQNVFLSILPLAHAYEQMCGLFIPLLSGCHIVYQESLDSFSLLSSFKKFQVTYLIAVPKFLEILRDKILLKIGRTQVFFYGLQSIALLLPLVIRRKIFSKIHKQFGGSLLTIVVAGAPLDSSIDRFFQSLGFTIIIGYGLTESAPILTISLNQRRVAGSVGQPIPEVSIEVAADGEIIASGPNISPGYWPIRNKSRGQKLFTGDIGFMDATGNLVLTGRKKNIVVFPTGDKIRMEDIEKVVNSYPGISDSCLVVLSDSIEKLRLGITYVGNCDERQLLSTLNKKLPLYARIEFIEKWPEAQLPRSHTLKLQRNYVHDYFVTLEQNKKS